MTMIDITDKTFEKKVDALASVAENIVKEMFEKADYQPLSIPDAEACLDALLVYTHMRIAEYSKPLRKLYPTKQFTPNRLKNVENLWWTDHYTGGISEMSTLNWFSSMKVKKPSGKTGYPGASTHFVLGRHGYPFYIIPICHGAWHEPARNADSLSIELVNPGALKRTSTGWVRQQGTLPQDMVSETPPVSIHPAYRGATGLMPFTTDQIINLIKLKRIVLSLVKPRLIPERMTEHSVWRATKLDMGPLFPFIEVNRAAFEHIPTAQYDFVKKAQSYLPPGIPIAALPTEDAEECLNSEHGLETPTHDDDYDPQPKILSILEVQKILVEKGYYRGFVDGVYGPRTKQAVLAFQLARNNNAQNKLTVDGIPGPATCQALQTF